MLKILWKREEIAPEEQFLLLSTIFCYLMLDICVKTRIRFSLRDNRLFEITEVEITRVDCIKLEFDIISLTKHLCIVMQFQSVLVNLFKRQDLLPSDNIYLSAKSIIVHLVFRSLNICSWTEKICYQLCFCKLY